MCGGVACSLALVGCDGKDLPSPGNDGPDGNLTLLGGVLSGEQGAVHQGEVRLGEAACHCLCHEADDTSPYSDNTPRDGLGSHSCYQLVLDTHSDLIPHVSANTLSSE